MRSSKVLVACLPALLMAAGCSGYAERNGESATGSREGTRTGCAPQHEFPTVKAGRLTVVAYVSPPYTNREADRIGGVDGDIIAEVAELECLELDASTISMPAAIPAIQSGRADVFIGGLYRTPERAEVVALTNTMWRDRMAFIAKHPVTRISELTGQSVGTVQGYLWTEDLGEVLPGGQPRLYPTTDALFADVENGRIDVGVLGTAEAALRTQQKPSSGIKVYDVAPDPRVAASQAPGEIVLAHPKGNDAMTRALNDDIARLRREGTIGTILKRHGLPDSAGDVA